MKKILCTILLLLIAVCARAETYNTSYYSGSPANAESTYTTTASTNTAVLFIPELTTGLRIGYDITNPNPNYNLYRSTYPATSADGLDVILPGVCKFYDVNPYIGDVYILFEPGQTPITVYGSQRWHE